MKRIVPGIHSVKETLLVRPKRITELWLREGTLQGDLEAFFHEATKNRTKIKRVAQQTLDKQVGSHQGVIAFVEGGPEWPAPGTLKKLDQGFFIALDSIEDPNNVGSIARSAWNLGCLGILTSKDRSAGITPAAEKVASGGFEHVPVQEVSNLASELIGLKELGFWVYGLDGESDQSLVKTELSAKCVIVVGSEESGLRKPVAGACDALVSIPQSANSQSFNAAVAGAIVGYEFQRQRHIYDSSKDSRKKL
jgi:23S rRNA (guanosine2251-2'-O)-methyltransferase